MAPEIPCFEQIPKTITSNSSNLDVRLVIFNQLLKYDYNLAKHGVSRGQYKEMVKGYSSSKRTTGRLKFRERQGYMLFRKIEKEKMNSEKNIATDVSNFILFWN